MDNNLNNTTPTTPEPISAADTMADAISKAASEYKSPLDTSSDASTASPATEAPKPAFEYNAPTVEAPQPPTVSDISASNSRLLSRLHRHTSSRRRSIRSRIPISRQRRWDMHNRLIRSSRCKTDIRSSSRISSPHKAIRSNPISSRRKWDIPSRIPISRTPLVIISTRPPIPLW